MNLDFLDNGLPIEHNDSIDISAEIKNFINYCKTIKKKPSELTEEELNAFYKKAFIANKIKP